MIAIQYTAPVEGFVTLPEAARRIGITRAVLWRHVKAGHLGQVERAGKLYLLPESAVAAFASQQRLPGRPRKPAP